MKYPVKCFKSLPVCLKELERFIRDPQLLLTGRPSKRFGGMLPREMLANWLICVAHNSVTQDDRLTFTNDPNGGDGIIYDSVAEKAYPTEHVLVLRANSDQAWDIEALILKQVALKWSKGRAYASGKTLVIFLDAGGGKWSPNKVAKQLPEPLKFEAVWVVGLHKVIAGKYIYGVASLELGVGKVPTWLVRIRKDFGGWMVERRQ